MTVALSVEPEEKSKSPSDLDVVLAARSGGDEAFADLVERYAGLVRSLAYALTGSWHATEEIAQETFVVVWMRLRQMEDPERFRGWVCGIVRNLVLKKNRRQRTEMRWGRTAPTPGADLPSTDPSPLDRIISDEEERVMWRVLERIPETYRLPLILFYAEDRSLENVASALGLNLTSTRKRLSRGRQMMQDQVMALIESSLSRMRKRPLAPAVMAAILVARTRDAAAGGARPETATGGLAPLIGSTRAKAFLAGALALLAVPLIGTGLSKGTRAVRDRRLATDTVSAGTVVSERKPPQLAQATATPELSGGATNEEPPEADVLFDLDFESGVGPDALNLGAVVPGPSRPDSRYCVAGAIMPNWYNAYVIALQTDFRFSTAMVLSFDYWLGGVADSKKAPINVSLKKGPVTNYAQFIWEPTREAWTHAEIPFTGFDRAAIWAGMPLLQEGDALIGLIINGGSLGGPPIFIDNLKLVRSSPAAATR